MAKKDEVKAADDAEKTDAEDGAEGEGGKKKPPLKLLIAIGLAAVLVLGGGGATAFMLFKPKPDAAHAGKADHGKKKEKPKEGEKADPNAPVIAQGPGGVTFYTLPDIVVNMQSAEGRPTFLKLKLTFELPDEAMADQLTPNMPRLRDMFQTFLRELRPEDLQGSQGSYQLRMEIQRRVNLIVAPAKINAVLIEEMLIN